MPITKITLSLTDLTATELAALEHIVSRASVDVRSSALAPIERAGVVNAGAAEYAEERTRVSKFFGE